MLRGLCCPSMMDLFLCRQNVTVLSYIMAMMGWGWCSFFLHFHPKVNELEELWRKKKKVEKCLSTWLWMKISLSPGLMCGTWNESEREMHSYWNEKKGAWPEALYAPTQWPPSSVRSTHSLPSAGPCFHSFWYSTTFFTRPFLMEHNWILTNHQEKQFCQLCLWLKLNWQELKGWFVLFTLSPIKATSSPSPSSIDRTWTWNRPFVRFSSLWSPSILAASSSTSSSFPCPTCLRIISTLSFLTSFPRFCPLPKLLSPVSGRKTKRISPIKNTKKSQLLCDKECGKRKIQS